MLAFLCVLSVAAAQDLVVTIAKQPGKESKWPAKLPLGETRGQHFGIYLQNVGQTPLAIKKAKVWVMPYASCQLRTRDLTGTIRQVKQPSINVFDSEKTAFSDDNGNVTVPGSNLYFGAKSMVLYGSQRYTPIDPNKKYRLDTANFDKGEFGELAVSLAVSITPIAGRCRQCRIRARVTDENGVKYMAEDMEIFRDVEECRHEYA